MKSLTTGSRIEERIVIVRGHKVMLDSDLARLYGVRTSNLNTAVKRNRERFPKDFMFELTESEALALRLQTAASNRRGGRRYMPTVFTEQGVAMLSSVLRSKRAIRVNIAIMRAFIRLKAMVSLHDLREKIIAMEEKYDGQFSAVFQAIEKLFDGPIPDVKVKGFRKSEL